MRMIDLKFEPPKLKISQQEIMDDLRYPVDPQAPRGGRGHFAQGQGSVTADEAALGFAERSPERTRTRRLVWQDPVPTASAGAEMVGIDYMRALVAGELPPPPIAVTMRFAPIEVEVGYAVFEGEPGEEHYNPIGVVHGGYAATLLDSALGCAVHTHTRGWGGLHDALARDEVRPPDRSATPAASGLPPRSRIAAAGRQRPRRSWSPSIRASCWARAPAPA